MLRFGLPSGVSHVLEVAVWAGIILLMGSYGIVASASSSIAFGINSLAFMPVVGVGLAVSTLVGRRQGERNPDLSARTSWSAIHLVVVAMGLFSVLVVLVPEPFIRIFSENGSGSDPGAVPRLVRTLLRYVAIYVVFDATAIVLFSALRGAGDTLFPMWAAIGLAWGTLLVPSLALHVTGHGSLYRIWALSTAYLAVLAGAALLRFLGGKWRTMRVIEEEVVPPPVVPHADIPPAEME
jgi:MATE family multidrug resistance protein